MATLVSSPVTTKYSGGIKGTVGVGCVAGGEEDEVETCLNIWKDDVRDGGCGVEILLLLLLLLLWKDCDGTNEQLATHNNFTFPSDFSIK